MYHQDCLDTQYIINFDSKHEAKDNIAVEKSLYTVNMYYFHWLIQEQTDQYLDRQRLGEACRQEESMG